MVEMQDFNIYKTLELLEIIENTKDTTELIERIQKCFKISESEITIFLEKYSCKFNDQSVQYNYFCHLSYLLLLIKENVNLDTQLKNELISVKNTTTIFNVIDLASNSSLRVFLKKGKDTNKIPEAITYNCQNLNQQEYEQLVSSLNVFSELFRVQLISECSTLNDLKLDYIIGLLNIICLNKNEKDVERSKSSIAEAYKFFPKEQIFKFLMIIKGFLGFNKDFHLVVHKELLNQIRSVDGFATLCKIILSTPQNPTWQSSETIANIVLAVTQNKATTAFIIDEILHTLKISIFSKSGDFVGACVTTLKTLHAKGKEHIRKRIEEEITKPLQKLINPQETLNGFIVMDDHEIKEVVSRLFALFSGSSIASMPSKIIYKQIDVLFSLFILLPESPIRNNLASCINCCLTNRTTDELQQILLQILFREDLFFHQLHPKLVYKNDCLQVGDEIGYRDESAYLLEMLKLSNNSMLIYSVFLRFLNIFQNIFLTSEHNNLVEGSVSREDIAQLISKKFFRKLIVIESITNLIELPSIHAQFNENPKEVLELVKKIVEINVEKEADDKITIMLMVIYKEFIFKLKNEEQQKEYLNEVVKLKAKCKSTELKEQFDILFDLKSKRSSNTSEITYEDAINLLSDSEMHLKVYGINLLIKLLHQKDPQTLLNKHSVLAIALKNLMEVESYAYLNVIRLLVALTNVLESEVIDALTVRYQNKDLPIDERLKFGEVILKVTESLGAISYNYKDVLLKGFLIGCRSEDSIFRSSSLSNLAAISKVLSYQVHHFFHEMFLLLESIVKTDDYLPSKRAAVFVLSQILLGFDNLMDFQDYLLPIYRLFKEVMLNENDPQTRMHAELGLETLKVKTKQLLLPERKLEKEIKIILDDQTDKLQNIRFK